MMGNIDPQTVEGFGHEWSSFDQQGLSDTQKTAIFEDYFHIFPWDSLPCSAVGADIGCGSGRWATVVAPKVGRLHLVDASEEAMAVARRNLAFSPNCDFHHASVDALPFPEGALDFAYSLGVLHHVPDTGAAIRSIAGKLKAGAPFLLYLYYAFDNRPGWFRTIWRCTDHLRRVLSKLPFPARYAVSQVIAIFVYWPLARMARLLERFSLLPSNWPLMYYRNKSLYVMRTDALDRFGTQLEQRFTKVEIAAMLEQAGFAQVRFSDRMPGWRAVAIKAQ